MAKISKKNPTRGRAKEKHRILAKNSLFSYLIIYGNYLTALLTSFMVARLISQETWGFLITATSYITITSLLLIFLPPSLLNTLEFYIPKYRALKQYHKLKNFIRNSFLIRIMIVIPIFFINLLVFFLFQDFFKDLNLGDYIHLLYILSPLIIVSAFDSLINAIYFGFNRFLWVFLLVLLKMILNVGALLYFFILGDLTAEILAYINLFSALLPFILNCIIGVWFYSNIKKTDEPGLSLKTTMKSIFGYGSPLAVKDFLTSFRAELYTQTIASLANPEIVTGYNIGVHYTQIPSRASIALNKPLTIAFSEYTSKSEFDQVTKLFNISFEYSSFFLTLLSGILLYFVDFFLFFIYGESYVQYSLILKLLLISTIFNTISPLFFTLLRGTDNVKYSTITIIIIIIIKYPLFLFFLIYFDIIGALIGNIISLIIVFGVVTYLAYKILNLRVNLKKIMILYSSFFISISVIYFLELLFLNQLTYDILTFLDLLFFRHFKFLSLVLFIIIFFFLISISRFFTKKDIEYIESLFNKQKQSHQILLRLLRFLKKFLQK